MRSWVANIYPDSRDIRTSLSITEPIRKSHNVRPFDCGEPSLNEYLKRYAFKNDQNNISRTFVLVNSDENIIGYYSVCACSIEFNEIPEEMSGRLPKYPIPGALIARLAVDSSVQGNDYGSRLLIHALQRINQTSEELGIKIVVVDALHEKARSFYERYGFQSLPGNELKLFLPIETIKQTF